LWFIECLSQKKCQHPVRTGARTEAEVSAKIKNFKAQAQIPQPKCLIGKTQVQIAQEKNKIGKEQAQIAQLFLKI